MLNGRHQMGKQPHEGNSGRPLITISEIRLTWTQLAALFTGGGGLIAAGITGGWLFMPAKESDFLALKASVVQLAQEQKESRETLSRLTDAINVLVAKR